MSYGRGLRALTVATIATITLALALVFFYAPLDADQGFIQKIFYVHVPLAIVSLCGFILGGLLAIAHLRTRDRKWDMRSYVAIMAVRLTRTERNLAQLKRDALDRRSDAEPERDTESVA